MLAIGFANKFYTLWNISTSTVTNELEEHEVTTYTYIKNVSLDKEKAFNSYPEAKYMDDLKGLSRSFEVVGSTKELRIDRFNFGKYKGNLISECVDYSYMAYMLGQFTEERNKQIANTLEKVGYHTEKTKYNWLVWTPEEWEEELSCRNANTEFINKLKNNETIEVLFERNLEVGQDGNDNYFGTYNSGDITYHFPEITVNYYAGYEYGLPAINGKGKRIKNKIVEISEYDWNKNDNTIVVFVKKFNVKK